MNCVGIDVSKGKSMIAVMRPFGEVVEQLAQGIFRRCSAFFRRHGQVSDSLGDNLDAVIGKKAVGTEALRPRAGGDVVGIGFAGHHRMGVILNGTGDKLRCGANGFLGTVIFILQHLPAVWEIPEELCDQDLLLCRGRQQLFRPPWSGSTYPTPPLRKTP